LVIVKCNVNALLAIHLIRMLAEALFKFELRVLSIFNLVVSLNGIHTLGLEPLFGPFS
jgi:hypothetical protein